MKDKTSAHDEWVNRRRQIVEPTIEADPCPGSPHATKERHPAYGMIRASRVSGDAHLFASDFRHQHYMTVEISRAVRYRDLSNDWIHSGEELIEVALSEAQWATFVSSPNTTGVPCTLNHVAREPMPTIPRPQPRTDQFKAEMIDKLTEARGHLDKLRDRLASGKSGKESLALLDMAVRDIGNSLDFVAQQFGEHMEKQIESAKVEIATWMQQQISRAGLAALTSTPPLALDE